MKTVPLALGLTLPLAAVAVIWSATADRSSGGKPRHLQASKIQPGPLSAEATAKAVVLGAATHHFGIIDPTDDCHHRFVVRNEGTAPLRLTQGRTSCKCTMSEPDGEPIPPGGAAEVLVASKLQKEGEFSHAAEIITNDPAQAVIQLRLTGTIRRYLASDPDRVLLDSLTRSESHQTEVLIYSQVWTDFEIENVASSLAGFAWKAVPAAAERLEPLDARSGYRLVMTLPERTSGGDFWEWVDVTAKPLTEMADATSSRTYRVDVTGSVLSRFTLAGPRLDGARRVLQVGALRPGEGAREQLTLKIRDNHPAIRVEGIDTSPAYLEAGLEPLVPGLENSGLYRINVRIPPAAPAGNYLTSKKGMVRIMTDHPKLPVLAFEVAFAVSSQ